MHYTFLGLFVDNECLVKFSRASLNAALSLSLIFAMIRGSFLSWGIALLFQRTNLSSIQGTGGLVIFTPRRRKCLSRH